MSNWETAAQYAEDNLLHVLQAMVGMLEDDGQAATARAAVGKAIVDVAIKLHDSRERDAEYMDTFDRLMREFSDEIDNDDFVK